MFHSLKTTALVLALSATAVAASAATTAAPSSLPGSANSAVLKQLGSDKLVPLANGSILHVFPSGKMAMENQYGHIVQLKEGQVLQAKDGTTIKAHGDEEARLAFEKEQQQHR